MERMGGVDLEIRYDEDAVKQYYALVSALGDKFWPS